MCFFVFKVKSALMLHTKLPLSPAGVKETAVPVNKGWLIIDIYTQRLVVSEYILEYSLYLLPSAVLDNLLPSELH